MKVCCSLALEYLPFSSLPCGWLLKATHLVQSSCSQRGPTVLQVRAAPYAWTTCAKHLTPAYLLGLWNCGLHQVRLPVWPASNKSAKWSMANEQNGWRVAAHITVMSQPLLWELMPQTASLGKGVWACVSCLPWILSNESFFSLRRFCFVSFHWETPGDLSGLGGRGVETVATGTKITFMPR